MRSWNSSALRFRSTPLLALAAVAACAPAEPEPASEPAAVEFSDLRAEQVTSTSATLRFLTSVPTSCEAQYGTTPDALDGTATDPTMAEGALQAAHEVLVDGLMPNTEYHWRAVVADGDGAEAASEVLSFLTTADEDDGYLNVALPAEGATIVSVSSNFGGGSNDSTWGVNNAIDARASTEWASDGDGDDASFELRVQSGDPIARIGFQSRQMSDGSSIITSFQLVDDDDTVLGPFDTPDPDVRYQFLLDGPLYGPVIRFEAVTTTGGNTGLKDLELWVGTP